MNDPDIMPSEDESLAGSAPLYLVGSTPLYLSQEKQVLVTQPCCLSVSLDISNIKKPYRLNIRFSKSKVWFQRDKTKAKMFGCSIFLFKFLKFQEATQYLDAKWNWRAGHCHSLFQAKPVINFQAGAIATNCKEIEEEKKLTFASLFFADECLDHEHW